MNTPTSIIQFRSKEQIENHAYEVILRTINDHFVAAKGNLAKMADLNRLAHELAYATEMAMDELKNGRLPKKESTIPTAQPEVL